MSAANQSFGSTSLRLNRTARHLPCAAGSSPTAISTQHAIGRLALLDWLRIVAANLIVWHHLAYYGPVADNAYPLVPHLMDFLVEHARCAVQIFLVIGGFVAASGMGKWNSLGVMDAVEILRRRYLRIAGPYLVVLILAIGANSLADFWMDHASISAFPTVPQFLAHAVFLQEVLDYEPLTAGIWYLAIDFQLVMLVLLLFLVSQQVSKWTAASSDSVLQTLVILLGGSSLLWFNRNERLEDHAIYFFGSYAMGLLASWGLSGRMPAWKCGLYVAVMAFALAVEWRTRIAVSLTTGLVILATGLWGWLFRWTSNRWLALSGQCSYSLFLIHFPVCLVVNAWLSQHVLNSPKLSLAGLFIAYGLSVLAAVLFFYSIERPFRRVLIAHSEAG